eukprot:3845514-Alexandrium_andersonii.AAC.1
MGVSSRLATAVEDTHTCAWFSTQGLQPIVSTSRGSKPGDPLGDVLYAFMSISIMEQCEQELVSEGLCVHLPEVPECHVKAIRSGDRPPL